MKVYFCLTNDPFVAFITPEKEIVFSESYYLSEPELWLADLAVPRNHRYRQLELLNLRHCCGIISVEHI